MTNATLVPSPGVDRAIRYEAFRAWRSLRRFGLEPADVRQEFALHVLSQFERYDERSSSTATFTSRVCRRRTLQILEFNAALKRNGSAVTLSLSEPVGPADGAPAVLNDFVSDDEYAVRTGSRSRPAAELADLKIDVARVVATLPPPLAGLARSLAHDTIAATARAAGIGRATAHRRVAALRAIFVEAGLDLYLKPGRAERADLRFGGNR